MQSAEHTRCSTISDSDTAHTASRVFQRRTADCGCSDLHCIPPVSSAKQSRSCRDSQHTTPSTLSPGAPQAFTRANPGFVYDYQFIDVPDGPDGRGESVPVPYFFQNLAEAEYLVSLYQYMR
jgi:hypothetical protein